jgi:hypothetical protein
MKEEGWEIFFVPFVIPAIWEKESFLGILDHPVCLQKILVS